jgi:hypothetical protein
MITQAKAGLNLEKKTEKRVVEEDLPQNIQPTQKKSKRGGKS